MKRYNACSLAVSLSKVAILALASGCTVVSRDSDDEGAAAAAGAAGGAVDVPRGTAGSAGEAAGGNAGNSAINEIITLVGTVTAPNGTGIADATVDVFAGVDTSRPPLATTTSKPDGSFSAKVDTGGATTGTLVTTKGSWRKQSTVDFNGGPTVTVPKSATQFDTVDAGAPRIAVVTGAFDRMQDVLAKYGFGELEFGMLKIGTQKFTLINGDRSLDSSFQTSSTLFASSSELAKYDIILINCGTDESALAESAPKANIKKWVEQGGTLYATDQAYDFVEQLFPNAVAFYGGNLTEVPESANNAEVGDSGIELQATISDPALLAWAAAEPGVLTNGKLPITGFLGGWAVIDSVAETTRSLVHGPITFDFGKAGDKPLTVSFPAVKGKVIYSSYHTAHHEVPEATLIAQEKLLGYLLF